MKTPLPTYRYEFPPSGPPGRRLPARRPLRLGLVADLHFADKEPSCGRFYRDTLEKLDEALALFRSRKTDFVLELGDLKDEGDRPRRDQTLAFLDRVEGQIRKSGQDVYHVLGNHDMDSISKADFLGHTRNPGTADGKSYYAVERGGLEFLVLDANYRADQADYDSGDFDWTVAVVPDEELAWLGERLREAKTPVLVAVHELLAGAGGIPRSLFVRNADEVNRLLVASRRVLGVFQGHHHAGDVTVRDGIPYITFPAMIEGPYPETAFAIAEIDPSGTIRIEGYGRPPRLSGPLPT